MALGIAGLLEQFPATANDHVGTFFHVRVLHRDGGSRKHDGRSLDVVNGGHAALEGDVDVHHMTLADRCDMHTVGIALLVVVLIDDGDDLLRREVVDVGVEAYEQRTRLHGRYAVDGEAFLFVGQVCIVNGINHCSHGHCRSGDVRRAAALTLDTRHGFTLSLLIHLITLATIIEIRRDGVIALILIHIVGGESECGDMSLLLRISQPAIGPAVKDCSDGVWRLDVDEIGIDIIVTGVIHLDGRIVTLLVGQGLVIRTQQFCSDGYFVTVRAGIRIGHSGSTVIRGGVVNGLGKRVDHLRLVAVGDGVIVCLAVILVLTSCRPSVGRINEQVEGIVVELELITVGLRHGAPGAQGTVVLTGLIVVTAIEALLRTIVSFDDVSLDFRPLRQQYRQSLFLIIRQTR